MSTGRSLVGVALFHSFKHFFINWYIETGQFLAYEQAGFQKYRSTTNHVTQLFEHIKDVLDKIIIGILMATLVDFKL